MALYAIGDLHLSEGVNKPMDVFGDRWADYTQKLKAGFASLNEADTCVICGDVSWGMDFDQCTDDFRLIGTFPGRKIILKGNHDYWWTTITKSKKFLNNIDVDNIDFLHNNFFVYNDTALCGTRGWFYEEENGGEHDKKVMLREIGRLETSLKAAGNLRKLVFLHYPPMYGRYVCDEILGLFAEYRVEKCYYGHIHGKGCAAAFEGFGLGVEYTMVSADHVNFRPVKIMD